MNILISNDDFLRKKLENQLIKSVKIQDKTKSISGKINSEIIFDNNYIDFKTIIHLLEANKNKNFTFKILPKNSNFIIGSNSSNDRGEVVDISNFNY